MTECAGVTTILFDLDETLYPRSTGVMEQIKRKILSYMIERLGLEPDVAEELRLSYLQRYGTSMRGLQIHHAIDADDFLTYVHNLPIEELIQPAPELDEMLGRLPQDKVVFTNASREHAERVLRRLGVRGHFQRILDVRDLEFRSKPNREAYRRACGLLGVRPEQCMLVEDRAQNIGPAKELGMTTVLVDGADHESADHVIGAIEDLALILLDGDDTA
jgi:putative hydrolase of the HAD superfamily